MKTLLFWRLERGEKLGLLDVLAGSSSLAGTIITQLKSRVFTSIGPILVILWALSPLGGQASLRLVYSDAVVQQTTVTVEYVNTNLSIFDLDEELAGQQIIGIMDGLTTASLAASPLVKASSMDGWGNVKIPMLESFASSGQAGSADWVNIPADEAVDYSALIGLPLGPVATIGASNVSLQTSYWTLDCPNLYSEQNFTSWSNYSAFANLTDVHGHWFGSTGAGGRLFLSRNPVSAQPRQLIYITSSNPESAGNLTYAPCSIETTWIEAQVECVGQSCRVVSMRRSQQANPPNSWTLFDEVLADLDDDGDAEFASNWIDGFINMINGQVVAGTEDFANPVQVYLLKPDTPFDISAIWTYQYQLDPSVYSLRLAQLLNTYNNAHAGTTLITGNIQTYGTGPNNGAYTNRLNTTLTSNTNIPIIRCSTPWLIVLVVSTLAMMVAGVLKIVLSLLGKAPEQDLNISTLAKDNPYLGLPAGGSVLEASERMRLLRDLTVKFGDVMSQEEVGHLAIGAPEVIAVKTTKRRRLYK